MNQSPVQETKGPVADPEREVRFGLVLYGGVSLAVYIYGVVYEFQRLVRASEGREENAWTEVLQAADVTATVDIVSGASAGGINGLLLGKALVEGCDLRAVRSLWLDDAEFGALLHEASEKEPKSLLRSQRFRQLLDRGLAQMDGQSLGRPLVSAFDLFIAGTRLRPWVRRFRTDLGGTIQTLDYRKSFNLKYRRTGYNPEDAGAGYERNDFDADRNSMLADVAQATSAFPVAFEPVKIDVGEENEHLFDKEEPRSGYFSDGGILHNKPFTETISTILTRAAGRPVERWLVSVEPDPEQAAVAAAEETEPEVTEVASKAVFGIPRYQSIAADLARLQEHRERARRAREKLSGIDRALLARLSERDRAEADDRGDGLGGQILEASDYWDERRRRFSERLRDRLVRGMSARGRSLNAVRISLAVNELVFDAVVDADPDFERRRVYHLLEMVRPFIRDPQARAGREAIGARQLRLWAQYDRIQDLIWELFQRDPPRFSVDEVDGDPVWAMAQTIVEQLRTGLEPIRAEVRNICAELDELWLELGRRRPAPYGTVFERFDLWDAQLLTIEELSDAAARDEIRLARISPADAQFIQKSSSKKLAGDALGHFSGFLKREWRCNDVLWGRLDAAETIGRMLMHSAPERDGRLEEQIRTAQQEVFREELPDADGDYRAYMEHSHKVGEETLDDLPMEERANLSLQAADVIRNMFRRLQKNETHAALRALFGWLSKAVGFVLLFLRWPVRAVWGRDPALRRGANLGILFIGLWGIASLLLIVLGVVGTTTTLWTLTVVSLGIFVVWSILHALAP